MKECVNAHKFYNVTIKSKVRDDPEIDEISKQNTERDFFWDKLNAAITLKTEN